MGQLTITLPDELEAAVRKYVADHGYDSVSDLTREALSHAVQGVPYWQRIQLIHLMEIQQQLGMDIDQEKLDALRGGYSIYYMPEDAYGAEMPKKDMTFVMDVLTMYGYMQSSYKQAGMTDEALWDKLLFPGFDGNEPDGHLGFLNFLLDHDRFTYVEIKERNSHRPVTHVYMRMLEAYTRVKRGMGQRAFMEPLTLQDIQAILDARIHPDNR